MKKPRLTWRKQPNEKGLASVGQSPRGMELRCGGEHLGGCYPRRVGWGEYAGYYCSGRWDEMGVPLINTCHQPVDTIEEAQAILRAHFDKHIALKLQESPLDS